MLFCSYGSTSHLLFSFIFHRVFFFSFCRSNEHDAEGSPASVCFHPLLLVWMYVILQHLAAYYSAAVLVPYELYNLPILHTHAHTLLTCNDNAHTTISEKILHAVTCRTFFFYPQSSICTILEIRISQSLRFSRFRCSCEIYSSLGT